MLTWAEKLLNKSEEMENLGDFEREYIFGVSYYMKTIERIQ